MMLSRFALAVALAGTALAAPAAFAKDKEAAKPAGLKLTAAFVKIAKPAQDALNANDLVTAEPLVAQSEAAATNDDEKMVATQTRLVLEQRKINAARTANPSAQVDQTVLAKPLDALIANPSTPAADKTKYYFVRGQLAYFGKQYPVAIEYLNKAREAGSTEEQLPLFLANAKLESGDVTGGTQELDRAIAADTAAGKKAPEEWYKLAISRLNKQHQRAQTINWLSKYVSAYPSPQTWYVVLVTYGIQQESVAKLNAQEKIDLYRLMRISGGMGDQYSYIDYAQKAQLAGLPAESQAVLKEGIASGKVPATNTEAKAMLGETATSIKNEGSLTGLETKAKASASGSLAMQTADAYLGSGQNAKAVDLYRLALTKGGVDVDVVNSRMGIALARSGDKAGAATAFANVKTGTRGEIAQLWTTYLTGRAA